MEYVMIDCNLCYHKEKFWEYNKIVNSRNLNIEKFANVSFLCVTANWKALSTHIYNLYLELSVDTTPSVNSISASVNGYFNFSLIY